MWTANCLKVWRSQPVDATLACSLLAGVSKPKVFRGVDSGAAPLCRDRIESRQTDLDCVPQGFEQPPDTVLTATGCDHRKKSRQGNGRVREFLTLFVSSAHPSREHPAHGNTQKRVRHAGRSATVCLFRQNSRDTGTFQLHLIRLPRKCYREFSCSRLDFWHTPYDCCGLG
jgi:hypothetical protein